MNLLKLTESFRKIFAKQAAVELPAIPAPLREPWCHPDFYLAIAGKGIGPCFAFQIPEATSGFLVEKSFPGHDLIWFAGLYTQDYLSAVSVFLQQVQQELFPENENALFAISADGRRKFLPAEQAVGWKISLAGVECGIMTVYAAIPGYTLSDGAAVMVNLSLKTIGRLAGTTDQPVFEWASGIPVSRLAVLHAWQNPIATASVPQIKEILDAVNLLAGHGPEACLCHLLEIFGLYAPIIRAEKELQQLVAEKLAVAVELAGSLAAQPAGIA